MVPFRPRELSLLSPPPPPPLFQSNVPFFDFPMHRFVRSFFTNATGFVNPGYELPPIADPQLYFLFTNPHSGRHMDEKLQREEFIGDAIYAASLIQVLTKWPLPRPCIYMLFYVFSSNIYQEKLFRGWKLPKWLTGRKGRELVGKDSANAIEVSNHQHMVLLIAIGILFYRLKRPIVSILQLFISASAFCSASAFSSPSSRIYGRSL